MHMCRSLYRNSSYVHCSVVVSSVLSLPPQFSSGNLNRDNVVVESLEGHNVLIVEGLGTVAGGGVDDPEACMGCRS